jgi:GTPase
VSQKTLPKVVVVGRPNVGKSTLFNRITGSRRAIVTSLAGTTRDVIEQAVSWRDARFIITDTGGMFGDSADPLHEQVVEHGRRALEDADLFVFVTDGRDGLVAGDRDIAATIRVFGRPVIVTINKTDDKRARGADMEFYQLGFEPVVEISAEHGQGIGDLLDEVAGRLTGAGSKTGQAEGAGESEPADLRIAVVGRPNVGKSSLVNRMLREERVLVSDMPGTTRDTVDATLRWHRRTFRIFDTAGIRRPGRVGRGAPVEALSVMTARRALERADIVVLVIDAVEQATDQDGAIAGEAERAGCAVVIAANKWDLVKGQSADFAKQFDEDLRYKLKFLEFAPVVHLSAKTGERAPKLLEIIDRVAEARNKRVATGELNRFIQRVTEAHPPPSRGKTPVRILYAAQVGVAPPTFALFTNVADRFHFSYERYLINQLRESFGFAGTPIRLQVRRRTERASRRA